MQIACHCLLRFEVELSPLMHNANEEVEHAAMVLEWIRRREPRFDKELKAYLFTTAPITKIEKEEEKREAGK